MKRTLTTPISDHALAQLSVGDVIYLDGTLITCRDAGHNRLLAAGIPEGVDLQGGAILHAGPIVQLDGDGWRMIAVGPTTSMRMEKREKEFIEATGVRLIIGKGGMGPQTMEACRTHKAVHAVFPGGCAVSAAAAVERIERVEWLDLGMPEAFWICRVKQFGPLIVSIDTKGNNLFEQNKEVFRRRKAEVLPEIQKQVHFY